MHRAVRNAACLVALLATGSAVAADDGPAARETHLLAEINRVRADHGLAALSRDARLARAARAHARDMARNDFLDHAGSDGSRLADRVTRTGYPWTAIAENVAAGQPGAMRAVREWMASPCHLGNILEPEMRHAGAGHAFVDGDRPRYRHYWTVVFGRTRR